MGSVVQRNDKYRAMVRVVGHKSMSRSFSTARAAKLWIAETELALANKTVTDPTVHIDVLVDEYARRVGVDRKMAPSHLSHDMPALKRKFAGVRLADLEGRGLIDWALAQRRMKAGSRGRFVALLYGLLRQAELHMGVAVPWDDLDKARKTLLDQGVIGASSERDRRVSDAEIQAIVAAMPAQSLVRALVPFLVTTCMRVGEACRIEWGDVDAAARTVLIRDRKHPREKWGNNQRVPLLGRSFEMLPSGKGRCWRLTPKYASAIFRAAAKAAGVADVVLHDLRHEGISRMFEAGFQIPEVALVSGHRDWKQLRRYTNLRAEHLHAREAAMKKTG
mgnify:CR=1 FL=1|nr:MAG TPA_asm: Integrase [Caudoviricetes sp.]